MKKYYNSTTNEWYNEGQGIVKRLENGSLFMGVPTSEQLSSWGYEEYVEPTPSESALLQQAKNDKFLEIEAYDSSDSVNSFSINGQDMWLTVEERQQLATQISACQAIGRTNMTRWFDGISYTFPISTWQQMLVALEVYAGDAINVTEGHKAAVNALNSISDVNNYNYTSGYPQKLEF